MANVLYVTTDNIRASLGVTAEEIEDDQIINLKAEAQLAIDLETVYPAYAALKAAYTAPSPSAETVRLYSVLELYMQYQGACYLLPVLQMLVAQKNTDSDFEMQRFTKDTLEQTINGVTGQRDKYAAILQLAAGIESATANVLSPVASAPPAYDPVTNV